MNEREVNSLELIEPTKTDLRKYIATQLSPESEVQKIIIFGSFLKSNTPNDIDIAVFQNSSETYLNLSLKYRKLLRELYRFFPIDVIPLRWDARGDFVNEIKQGEVIYEKE